MKYYMTHSEIGEKLGLSRHRVSQIEREALHKLRLSGKLDKFYHLLQETHEEYYGEEHKPLRSKT